MFFYQSGSGCSQRLKQADVPLTQVKVQTGHIPTSTPEATALDLIRYARRIGGLDRVLTVLQELGEVIEPGNLEEAAKSDSSLRLYGAWGNYGC